MPELSRRAYLKGGGSAAAAAVAVLGLGSLEFDAVGQAPPEDCPGRRGAPTERPPTDGTPAAEGCDTDLERDPDGDVDFEFDGISFETDGGAVEFTVEGDPYVDLEVAENAVDLVVATAGERLELETDGSDVAVDGTGRTLSYDDDGGDIEYVSPAIDVEWDGRSLDVDSPLSIEWETGAFEFRHGVVLEFDAATEEFEFECSSERSAPDCRN